MVDGPANGWQHKANIDQAPETMTNAVLQGTLAGLKVVEVRGGGDPARFAAEGAIHLGGVS
jgi:hypothetical protein